MPSDQKYYTVDSPTTVEHRVKDSLFIAHLRPANSREQAEDIISMIRAGYADATHNC
ncbi:MAG: YigZ family protein, partial [Calditrichaeota bacterium]